MGNANTHVNDRERRKSRGDGGLSIPVAQVGGGGGGGGAAGSVAATITEQIQRRRRNSSCGEAAVHPGAADVGPVEVTAAVHRRRKLSIGSRSPSSSRGSPSPGRSTQAQPIPYRPRATTEVGRRTKQLSVDEVATSGGDELDSYAPFDADANRRRVLPTILKYNGKAKEVYVAGSFNNWKRIRMTNQSTNDFQTILNLEEGDYEYKFIVDGEWTTDPAVSDQVVAPNGVKNSLMRVRKEDFNAFDALDMDSEAVLNSKNKNSRNQNGDGMSLGESYGQDMPAASLFEQRSGPPILPPHLLQVILNKDTPLSCEPTLLPEPNHVMLNHLYALSIKEGVMVLSSTQRYKRKYVTSLLYKPMGSRKAD